MSSVGFSFGKIGETNDPKVSHFGQRQKAQFNKINPFSSIKH
ncbi:MAG TPA: hypothetical protein VGC97_08725 [Pyrinomonadaceae bacterium]